MTSCLEFEFDAIDSANILYIKSVFLQVILLII